MTKKIDTDTIKDFGIKIVMNEEKIINENKYSLEEIYNKIDELAEFARMKKIDKYNYISKNDTPSDLGCFVWSNLNKRSWFIENVKEWLWHTPADGILDIIEYINTKERKYAKVS